MRQYMVRGAYPDEIKPLAGKRLLGCDSCQICCPENRLIRPVEAPRAFQDLFRLEGLLDLERRPALRRQIADAIGANYARTRYLTALAVVAAGNTGQCLDRIAALTDHEDERIRQAARYYTRHGR